MPTIVLRDGLCQCGCGELAPVAKHNDAFNGRIKGQPLRFIKNHDKRKQVGHFKTCSGCGRKLKISCFYKHPDGAGGRQSRCKKCVADRLRKWRHSNPTKSREQDQVRRARKRSAFIEYVDAQVVFERDEGICGICGNPVDHNDYHIDHIIPLARDGEHSYANTQVAHPACNHMKNCRLEEELSL
jgi:5-methylcytosine-specific restriction endonuclease McrA